jgi:lipopolysaccharide transport system permease protein
MNEHTREAVVAYTPGPSFRDGRQVVREMARDFAASVGLAAQFASSDLRTQYRQTALGIFWAFLLPMANAAIWLFIQSTGIVRVAGTGLPYPVYVVSGTLLWSIFMDAVNAPLQQTLAARQVLPKINFPREALILAGLGQTAFNAAIKLLVLMAIVGSLGVAPGASIVLLPVTICALILAGTSIGLLLTPIGTLYLDVGRGLPLLLQFLMFLSPVVYAAPRHGWASTLFRWNPLSTLLSAARATLTGEWPTHWGAFVAITAGTLVLLSIGWIAYRAAMPILIERMGT